MILLRDPAATYRPHWAHNRPNDHTL